MKYKIIAISGKKGSGKTTLANKLKNMIVNENYHFLSFSTKLKEICAILYPNNNSKLIYQIVGEHIKPGDLVLNLCTAKQMTNFRAAGKDDNSVLAPPRDFTLEEAMEYIQGDEYVEVTPENIRLRKIILDENERKRAGSKASM
jgi:predicted membrane GTPase involved in stress response